MSLIFLSGCWDAKELANLAIVAAVGIDTAAEPGDVLITIQVVKPGDVKSGSGGNGGGEGQSSQKSGGQQAYLVLQSSGKTVAEAFRKFSLQLNRELYLPDNQIIIYGKQFAKQGIRKSIDYFVRTRNSRETTWVLVADGQASEVLQTGPRMEKVPALEITGLIHNQSFASEVSSARVQDVLNQLLSKTQAPHATLIKVTGETVKKPELTGTAVFKDEKLAGQFDKEATRGFLWIIGKVKRGVIEIRSPKNELIDLDIISAKSVMAPRKKSGKISIQMEITTECSISGGTITEDPTKTEVLKAFNKLLTQAIHREITTTLRKSHQLNCDVFGFGEAIHRKYPNEWKKLEPKWEREFIKVPVKFHIRANIIEFGLEYKPLTQK